MFAIEFGFGWIKRNDSEFTDKAFFQFLVVKMEILRFSIPMWD